MLETHVLHNLTAINARWCQLYYGALLIMRESVCAAKYPSGLELLLCRE